MLPNNPDDLAVMPYVPPILQNTGIVFNTTAFERRRIVRLTLEALEVAFHLCNLYLERYGFVKLLDVINQIIPTAYIVNTGYWAFYSSITGPSICVCSRFGIRCPHIRNKHHWLNMEAYHESEQNCVFTSQSGSFCPIECSVDVFPIMTNYFYAYDLRITMTVLEKNNSANEIITTVVESRYAVMPEKYPQERKFVQFSPHPLSHPYYAHYFPNLHDFCDTYETQDQLSRCYTIVPYGFPKIVRSVNDNVGLPIPKLESQTSNLPSHPPMNAAALNELSTKFSAFLHYVEPLPNTSTVPNNGMNVQSLYMMTNSYRFSSSMYHQRYTDNSVGNPQYPNMPPQNHSLQNQAGQNFPGQRQLHFNMPHPTLHMENVGNLSNQYPPHFNQENTRRNSFSGRNFNNYQNDGHSTYQHFQQPPLPPSNYNNVYNDNYKRSKKRGGRRARARQTIHDVHNQGMPPATPPFIVASGNRTLAFHNHNQYMLPPPPPSPPPPPPSPPLPPPILPQRPQPQYAHQSTQYPRFPPPPYHQPIYYPPGPPPLHQNVPYRADCNPQRSTPQSANQNWQSLPATCTTNNQNIHQNAIVKQESQKDEIVVKQEPQEHQEDRVLQLFGENYKSEFPSLPQPQGAIRKRRALEDATSSKCSPTVSTTATGKKSERLADLLSYNSLLDEDTNNLLNEITEVIEGDFERDLLKQHDNDIVDEDDPVKIKSEPFSEIVDHNYTMGANYMLKKEDLSKSSISSFGLVPKSPIFVKTEPLRYFGPDSPIIISSDED